MNKEQLHTMFEYKDGNLIYKIKTSKKMNIGDEAGHISPRGYITISINYKIYMAHRLVWMFHYGDIPTGIQIDHINQNKSDNRIENLRLATISQNHYNITKRKNNTSGYKGVSRYRRGKKWEAVMSHNNKKIHLGLFATPELASEAYKEAAIKLQGEFACWE